MTASNGQPDPAPTPEGEQRNGPGSARGVISASDCPEVGTGAPHAASTSPAGAPPAPAPAPGPPDPSKGRVVVEVAIRVQSPNRREHYLSRARRVRGERAAVRTALERLAPPPLPWRVTLVRLAPRRLDDDNATAAMKGARDETAVWLRVDDGDEARVRFVVEQERATGYAVRIVVEHAEVRP